MSYQVRIYCGGVRGDFLLSKGIKQPNGDIEPGPVQKFETAAGFKVEECHD